jgi:hypothetical protein
MHTVTVRGDGACPFLLYLLQVMCSFLTHFEDVISNEVLLSFLGDGLFAQNSTNTLKIPSSFSNKGFDSNLVTFYLHVNINVRIWLNFGMFLPS